MRVQKWISPLRGLESLSQVTGPLPTPGRGEVFVKINAVALNYRDVEVVKGEYKHHKTAEQNATIVPCSDMCGTILSVGPEVSQWTEGDRVLSTFVPEHYTGQVTEKALAGSLGLPVDGVLATHRIFPAHALVAAPAYMSDEEACTLPIAALTAWMSINGARPMGQAGGKHEYILVQGTGGVAIAGLQIAKAAGAKVIITSSSDAKLIQAKQLGADCTINYRTTPNWEDEVMQFTQGNGADIILETGGAQTLRKSFDCIAWGGLINCIGYVSGKVDATEDRLNVNLLALRRTVTLKGILNGPKDRFKEMLQFYGAHQIHPVVNQVFSFAEAKKAFEFLESGSHFGKVIIQIHSQ
ncbi:hypothetical protein N7478_003967 [Penicillium angulare]|uniref:uncharacterized protein n=1 Tax=Penicillium angulare TaxID=116970 RepID=UPI00253FF31C|nr:uncharacterized protein N7478_003967 [Penicillium angulare]KAJ5278595.1 hypothetical protein N7478_003967 [Penicillium angulare]